MPATSLLLALAVHAPSAQGQSPIPVALPPELRLHHELELARAWLARGETERACRRLRDLEVDVRDPARAELERRRLALQAGCPGAPEAPLQAGETPPTEVEVDLGGATRTLELGLDPTGALQVVTDGGPARALPVEGGVRLTGFGPGLELYLRAGFLERRGADGVVVWPLPGHGALQVLADGAVRYLGD